MPFVSMRAKLSLSEAELSELICLRDSRSEPSGHVLRSKILLLYHSQLSVSAISRELKIDRPRVERTIDKALEIGALASLNDLPGRGRQADITDEAKAWLRSVACQKPVDLGMVHGSISSKLSLQKWQRLYFEVFVHLLKMN